MTDRSDTTGLGSAWLAKVAATITHERRRPYDTGSSTHSDSNDLVLAGRQVSREQSVIVDGLFSENVLRARTEQVEVLGGRLRVIECFCSDEELHRSRVEGRVRDMPGWHEIDWEHVLRSRERYPAAANPDLVLDALDPLQDNVSRALGLHRA